MSGLVVDLFAGPGGWSEGARALGITDELGIEWDTAACETARAAGHVRLQADVAKIDPFHITREAEVWGEIGSPPCQSFSPAGKGLGKLDRPALDAHVALVAAEGWQDYSRDGWHDPRSPLVLEPLRYTLAMKPEWVALEQVPAVLPLWEAYGAILATYGYSVAAGVLSAEQYGVPQTRRRAILLASRTREVTLPAPTHSRYYSRDPKRLDPGVLPWVSMAQALGWARDDDLAYLNAGKGFRGDRGPATRSAALPAFSVTTGGGSGGGTGHVPFRVMRSNYGSGGDPAARGERAMNEPAPTVTSKVDRNKWTLDRPAPTIVGTRRSSEGMLVRRQMPDGEGRDPAIYGGKNGTVGLRPGALPAVRVSVAEASVLQSFPADYPWQGSRTAQFRQVGDAVPPLLARAVLGQVV